MSPASAVHSPLAAEDDRPAVCVGLPRTRLRGSHRSPWVIKGITQAPKLLSSLQFCLAGWVKIFGFGLGENSQNVSQVARGVPDHLCASALQTLAKSFSELQENTFVVRIAELRLGPLPHGTFRFENTVFNSPMPDRQRLILFAQHGLEEGFNQYVH